MAEDAQPIAEDMIELREIRRRPWRGKQLISYEVVRAGAVLGEVGQRTTDAERRTPGRNYVNARWTTTEWYFDVPGEHRTFSARSRREAVANLLRTALSPTKEGA